LASSSSFSFSSSIIVPQHSVKCERPAGEPGAKVLRSL
jgi:hypothetical protein